MQLLGLSWSAVAGLFAAIGALIVALYFLRVRRREVVVPFSPLFEQLLRESRQERLFGRLRWWLSLLLTLIFAAALSFALGDPRRSSAGEGSRTLVVLVDASASMAAGVGESRMEEARRRVHALVDDLGPDDLMLIARAAEQATPLSGLTDDPAALHVAVDALTAGQAGWSPTRALDLARDVLADHPHPEVVFVSDGAEPIAATGTAPPEGLRLSQLRVGEPTPNVGILSFAARRLPLDRGRAAASIELLASGPDERRVELTVLDSDRPIHVERMTLPAGGRVRPTLPTLSGAEHHLRAELRVLDGLPNALTLDDRAYALLPERRPLRVLAVGPGDLYLSAALLLDELLDVTEMGLAQYDADAAHADDFDVLIFDRCVPRAAPSKPAFYLAPRPTDGRFAPLEVRGEQSSPYFERVDRRAPLLRYVALDDVNIARALKVVPQRGDRVLGASPDGPLLIQGRRDSQPFLALAFAPQESDLVLRVAWPVLLLDGLETLTSAAPEAVWSTRTGESRTLRLPEAVAEAVWQTPTGEERPLRSGANGVRLTPDEVGVHAVRYGADRAELAANLGRFEESNTAASSEEETAVFAAPSRGRPGLRRSLWPALVGFGLAWLLFEWWAWHRRWLA